DPLRGELFNVGLTLIGAHTYAFRMLDRFTALRSYVGEFDQRLLDAHSHEIEHFFKARPYYLRQPDGYKKSTNRLTREVLEEFVTQHTGPQLSYGPVCRVEGNIDSTFALQNLLTDLFEQFVLRRPSVRTEVAKRKERVKTILRNEFDACDFFNPEKYRSPMHTDQAFELPRHGYTLPLSFSFNSGGRLYVFEAIDAIEQE